MVDWAGYARTSNYLSAKAYVPHVARGVKRILDHMIKNQGLILDRIHVLGFSLGAHVAGHVGEFMESGRPFRISGFDPASPFYFPINADTLDESDAIFVDVYHSCINFYGTNWEQGNVDFWINKGYHPQPGCGYIDFSCSHTRSYEYYAKTIEHVTWTSARPCSNWVADFAGFCDPRIDLKYGDDIDFGTTKGSFYVFE